MFAIIGVVVVIACVLGSYVAMGGHIDVLIQPFELVIIGGSGLGAFLIANSKEIIFKSFGAIGAILKGPRYKKADYQELLMLLYQTFRLAKTKGMLALEAHVENPEESLLFQQFPGVLRDHHTMDFLCDYLRLLTLGTDNPHEVEGLMDQELEAHHHHELHVAHAIKELAESFPGLGIVAAVLGVIKTMGAITEPPEVLGGLIAAALVGTFLGILLCYGFVGPMATAVKSIRDEEHAYLVTIKQGVIAHLQGYAPVVSVEFARKSVPHGVRPTFKEVEDGTGELAPI
ncbi:MAG: flagellar motor stator protein MotA [Alphaproteobacteria bacterium]